MKKLLTILVVIIMATTTYAQNSQNYLLGDVNRDGRVTVADAMMVVNIIMNGYTSFSVSPTAVTMPAGDTAEINIEGGYHQYEVTSSNNDVVKATLNGSIITLTAVACGKATVTVKDVLTMRYVEIPVTVDYVLLQLFSSELSLILGEVGTVEVASGSGSYMVRSSDTGVVTTLVEGYSVKAYAVGVGAAIITVTDTKSSKTATIAVTVSVTCPDDNHPHMIDLGLPSGTKWACCNVGANKPEDYGGYYSWGETETKVVYNEVNYLYCTGEDIDGDGLYDKNKEWQNLGNDIAGTQYDVAYVMWGGSWVMPSEEQQLELLNNCTYEWTTLNGVYGNKFISKTNGVSIFLPAAGYFYDSYIQVQGAGEGGIYWSSTQDPSRAYNAYHLYFDSGWPDWYYYDNRHCGQSVRPVVSKLMHLFRTR